MGTAPELPSSLVWTCEITYSIMSSNLALACINSTAFASQDDVDLLGRTSLNVSIQLYSGHHESVTPSHSSRTVEQDAAILPTHLKPHMGILDIRCSPGTITRHLCVAIVIDTFDKLDR